MGEKVRDAVIREVKEECGLDIEVERLIDVFDSVTRDRKGSIRYQFVVVNFLAKIKGGILKNADDVLEAEWVPINKVGKYNLTDSFRAFFQKHFDKLKQLSLPDDGCQLEENNSLFTCAKHAEEFEQHF